MDDKNQKRYLVQGVEKKNYFSGCFLSFSISDERLMAVNDKYLALAYLGKGNIKLLDSSKPNNFIYNYPTISLDESNILDMEFSPFDSDILGFCNENSKVLISKINCRATNDFELNSSAYEGNEKKVNFINFNPIASNIMVSGTSFGDIHIWESKEFKTCMNWKLEYNPSTILWSPNGDLIGITAKNKILTIYDPRNRKAIFQEQISQNSSVTKFAWLDNNTVTTVGISKNANKTLSLIDIRKSNSYQYANDYISSIEIDRCINVTFPFVNPELKLIYCVGKEEDTIRVFDYYTGMLKKNNEFKASESNNFSVLLNRQYLNKSKMEVDRFARYTKNKNIFYVSFNLLPGQNFEGILYPSDDFAKPQMDSNEWIKGKKFEKIQTKVFHKSSKKDNIRYQTQNDYQKNNIEKKITSRSKYFDKFLNIEKNVKKKDNRLSNSISKKRFLNISKQFDNKNLNKKLKKKQKSRDSKDLKHSLKVKENEIEDLSKQMKLIDVDDKYNIFNIEINKYKRIIQEKERKIKVLMNDYKQKEEKSSKIIDILKTEINEKIYLLKLKENEIMKKDNIIKEYELKIKSLEEEKEKYLKETNKITEKYEQEINESGNKLNINNIEKIKLEYEEKILLLKEQLRKDYKDKMSKEIQVIKNLCEENVAHKLNDMRKSIVKAIENNLNNLKDKYNKIFSYLKKTKRIKRT